MPRAIDENEFVVQSFLALTLPQIRNELREVGIPVSGTKDVLKTRLTETLESGELKVKQLVNALDNHSPWSQQHVYLLKGPPRIPVAFRSRRYCQ